MSNISEKQKITLKPDGDIVASAAGELRDEILSLVSNGIAELTIDLSSVEMIDSVGLGVFIATQNSLSKADGKLKVCNVSEDICKLFKTMRLDQHFTVTGCN